MIELGFTLVANCALSDEAMLLVSNTPGGEYMSETNRGTLLKRLHALHPEATFRISGTEGFDLIVGPDGCVGARCPCPCHRPGVAIMHVVSCCPWPRNDHGGPGMAEVPVAFVPTPRPWWEVLGIPKNKIGALSIGMVESYYRKLATRRHPDKGGSKDAMVELNAAIEQAREHYRW